jgi:8-oxo-dGTP pyrophosphatase MutT (NUDIX family)
MNKLRIIKRDIVGAYIFSNDGKLLLGKNVKGGVYASQWVIPGGGIEPDETKLDALKRETEEETGIDISNADIIEIEGTLNGQSEKVLKESGEKVLVDMIFYNFKVSLKEKSSDIKFVHEDDFEAAEWFDTKDLASLNISPPTVTTLKKIGVM